jgi:flagellar M-ring protein FliF
MDQLRKIFASLTTSQKITIALVALMVAGGVWGFVHWKRESDFRPLYTGMAPEDAGAVLQKLRESGVDYRLSENGSTVLVPSAKLAEMRIEMAAAGLPKSGRIGYEIFDKANYGATEFVEHINYRRALEGELERSIMAMSEVESARVHLTFPKDSVFLESKQPAKASVLLRLRTGRRLPPQNVAAINHLVASAVEGLSPDGVSVMDMQGNLLSRGRKSSSLENEASDELLDYRQKVERDLVLKINSTLEPLLGPDKFRAAASVDVDMTSGEQSDETFDPARSVMVSSQRTEDLSGPPISSGVPGTASNLPRPTSRPGSALAGISRKTESIAYQSSRSVRRVHLPQGGIRRMSLSVLVDHAVRFEGNGAAQKRVLVPPAPERMRVIRDLVAASTGFSQPRGDQLIVETLPFESTISVEPSEQMPAPGAAPLTWAQWLERLKTDRTLQMMVGGALVAVLLLIGGLIFLFRRLGKGGPAGEAEAEGGPAALGPGGNEERGEGQQQIPAPRPATPKRNLLAGSPARTEALADEIREVVAKDVPLVAQNVRKWLSEERL